VVIDPISVIRTADVYESLGTMADQLVTSEMPRERFLVPRSWLFGDLGVKNLYGSMDIPPGVFSLAHANPNPEVNVQPTPPEIDLIKVMRESVLRVSREELLERAALLGKAFCERAAAIVMNQYPSKYAPGTAEALYFTRRLPAWGRAVKQKFIAFRDMFAKMAAMLSAFRLDGPLTVNQKKLRPLYPIVDTVLPADHTTVPPMIPVYIHQIPPEEAGKPLVRKTVMDGSFLPTMRGVARTREGVPVSDSLPLAMYVEMVQAWDDIKDYCFRWPEPLRQRAMTHTSDYPTPRGPPAEDIEWMVRKEIQQMMIAPVGALARSVFLSAGQCILRMDNDRIPVRLLVDMEDFERYPPEELFDRVYRTIPKFTKIIMEGSDVVFRQFFSRLRDAAGLRLPIRLYLERKAVSDLADVGETLSLFSSISKQIDEMRPRFMEEEMNRVRFKWGEEHATVLLKVFEPRLKLVGDMKNIVRPRYRPNVMDVMSTLLYLVTVPRPPERLHPSDPQNAQMSNLLGRTLSKMAEAYPIRRLSGMMQEDRLRAWGYEIRYRAAESLMQSCVEFVVARQQMIATFNEKYVLVAGVTGGTKNDWRGGVTIWAQIHRMMRAEVFLASAMAVQLRNMMLHLAVDLKIRYGDEMMRQVVPVPPHPSIATRQQRFVDPSRWSMEPRVPMSPPGSLVLLDDDLSPLASGRQETEGGQVMSSQRGRLSRGRRAHYRKAIRAASRVARLRKMQADKHRRRSKLARRLHEYKNQRVARYMRTKSGLRRGLAGIRIPTRQLNVGERIELFVSPDPEFVGDERSARDKVRLLVKQERTAGRYEGKDSLLSWLTKAIFLYDVEVLNVLLPMVKMQGANEEAIESLYRKATLSKWPLKSLETISQVIGSHFNVDTVVHALVYHKYEEAAWILSRMQDETVRKEAALAVYAMLSLHPSPKEDVEKRQKEESWIAWVKKLTKRPERKMAVEVWKEGHVKASKDERDELEAMTAMDAENPVQAAGWGIRDPGEETLRGWGQEQTSGRVHVDGDAAKQTSTGWRPSAGRKARTNPREAQITIADDDHLPSRLSVPSHLLDKMTTREHKIDMARNTVSGMRLGSFIRRNAYYLLSSDLDSIASSQQKLRSLGWKTARTFVVDELRWRKVVPIYDDILTSVLEVDIDGLSQQLTVVAQSRRAYGAAFWKRVLMLAKCHMDPSIANVVAKAYLEVLPGSERVVCASVSNVAGPLMRLRKYCLSQQRKGRATGNTILALKMAKAGLKMLHLVDTMRPDIDMLQETDMLQVVVSPCRGKKKRRR